MRYFLESAYTTKDAALYDAAYRAAGQILQCVHLHLNEGKDDIVITVDNNTMGLSDVRLYGWTIHPEESLPQDADYDDYVPVAHVAVDRAAFLDALNEKSCKIEDFVCWDLNIHEVGIREQLQEYLASDRFYMEREDYFWHYDHFQEDEPEYPDSPPVEQRFVSSVYLKIAARVKAEGGYILNFSDTVMKEIFDKGYSDTQLFAVVFGLWYGLTDRQLRPIRNLRNDKWCLRYLDFFICNPDQQEPGKADLEYIRSKCLKSPIPWQKDVVFYPLPMEKL